MTAIGGCTSVTCLDTATVAILFSILMGCFAIGYGIGQGVLWTRRLSEVA